MNTGRLLLEGDISSRIKDKKTLQYILKCMDNFPAYFWTAPSSQDFHPEDERKTGGLVLHVRRLIRVLSHLTEFYSLTSAESDVLMSAAALHDSFHKGLNKSPVADINHPVIAASMFQFEKGTIEKTTHDEIMDCVVSHMGKHSVHPSLNIDSKLTNIFKIADFLVSRKDIITEI